MLNNRGTGYEWHTSSLYICENGINITGRPHRSVLVTLNSSVGGLAKTQIVYRPASVTPSITFSDPRRRDNSGLSVLYLREDSEWNRRKPPFSNTNNATTN